MYQVYQVLPGETIESIANKINIMVDELRRLNGISENAIIKEGSYIIIPKGISNSDYKSYIVKPGDNIYAIARDNNIDFKSLLKINGLNENDYIYPNQEIILPNKNMYVTSGKDTIRDIMNRLNVSDDKLYDLYLMDDQVIYY